MADVKIVKSIYTGSDVTSLGEVAAADNAAIPGTVSAGGAKLTGGANTFNLTNGTASLDVAAGAVVNIDDELHVTAATHLDEAVAMSSKATQTTGTWEAALICGTSGTITLNASFNLMSYVKIGSVVHIAGAVLVDSVNLPVGKLTMTGLPFTNQQGAEISGRTAISIYCVDLNATAATHMQAWIDENTNVIIIEHYAAGVSGDAAADIKAGSLITIGGMYIT